MFNLTGTQRLYLIIALAFLVTALTGVLIYFQHNALTELREEIEEEKAALDAAQATLDRRLEHQQRADKYEERLDYALSKMPAKPEEEELLRYIHRLVGEYDLRAVEISFGDRSEDDEGFMNMPLTIILEGRYNGIRRLFNDLYGGDRLFRIDSFDLSPAGENGTALQVNISAYTFYNP
ncbi:MAG: type 4a pilus biogenesis protein PilO [Bacillota bacterium]